MPGRPNEPGGEGVEAFLIVPSWTDLRGRLAFRYADGTCVRVDLDARYSRLVLALFEHTLESTLDLQAEFADLFDDLPAAALRGAEWGRLYGRVEPKAATVSERTIRGYVRELRALLHSAVELAAQQPTSGGLAPGKVLTLDVPLLIESCASGYRIGPCGLTVTRPRGAGPSADED